jgi:hypothetical protein
MNLRDPAHVIRPIGRPPPISERGSKQPMIVFAG